MKLDRSTIQWVGLVLGPLAALITYAALPESYESAGKTVEFGHAGRAAAAVGAWMAAWWLTEAVHVSATALLPLALLPLLGAMKIDDVAEPYGHHLIFLFMGGFILSLAMQKWGLHRRVALLVLRMVGTKPRNMVGGFMLTCAVMSMWVSNTATAVMMLPIALSVIELVDKDNSDPNLSLCLMLGIAYACSIGGIGTIIGTPPNLFLVSYMRDNLGHEISFAAWLKVGLPVVALFLPIAWVLLTRWLYPLKDEPLEGADTLTRDAYAALGPMSRGEITVGVVFFATAALWIFRPLLAKVAIAGVTPFAGLSDAGIAILSSVVLFVIPVDVKARVFAIDWDTARKLPWGILVLFGGGLSLAAALSKTGVGNLMGAGVAGLSGVPPLVVVFIVVAMIIFLTELTSNTATTAALVPILASVAPGFGMQPYLLIIPAAIAASCAFMMPVATPPNAIVFGSGFVTIPQMSRAGIWLNLIGIVLVTAIGYWLVGPALGLSG